MLALMPAPTRPRVVAPPRRSYVVPIGVRRTVGSVVWKGDVQRLQKAIIAQVSDLDAAVSACLMKLDPAVVDQWHTQKNTALIYAGETAPTFFVASAMDAGQAIQKDLATWPARLTAAGCTNVPPAPTIDPPSAPLFGFLGQLPPVAMLALAYFILRQVK